MRRSDNLTTTPVFTARHALPWLITAIVFVVVILALPEPAIAYVDPPGYLLPWTAEQWQTVTQGWNTGSHTTTNSFYAYDFGLSANTPVRAARSGTVAWIKDTETTCFDNPNVTGNNIVINHNDGTATLYMHLAPKQNGLPYGVLVANGNRVHQGAMIGRSGNTGYVYPCNNGTGGYHLHFNHQAQGGQPWTTSQAVYFEEYPGWILVANSSYQSRDYDHAVLVADAPLPGAYAGQLLHLRPQDRGDDFRIYPISGGSTPWDGWNDDPSAIHVPEGVNVTLYADITYGGLAETFSATDKWLPDNSIGNDNASSMRYDGVWLFEHLNYNADNNYEAKAEFFNVDASYLPNNYIGNDSATSLTVGHNWRVTLYQHAWQTGNYLDLGEGNYGDLRNYYCGCGGDGSWNDQVSSLRVYRVGP